MTIAQDGWPLGRRRSADTRPDSAIGRLWWLGGRESITIVQRSGATITYRRPTVEELYPGIGE